MLKTDGWLGDKRQQGEQTGSYWDNSSEDGGDSHQAAAAEVVTGVRFKQQFRSTGMRGSSTEIGKTMRQIWREEESGLRQVKSEMSFRISNSVTLRARGWMYGSQVQGRGQPQRCKLGDHQHKNCYLKSSNRMKGNVSETNQGRELIYSKLRGEEGKKSTKEPEKTRGQRGRPEHTPSQLPPAASNTASETWWLRTTQTYYLDIYHHGPFLYLQNASLQLLLPQSHLLLLLSLLFQGPGPLD